MTRDSLETDDAPPELARPAVAPGAVIAERYRLEARLGAGGAGTVWRCVDQKLDAVVALKIVSADGDLERWRREVAMARRIADRNVCRVHDLGDTAELRFVTMELVEGKNLRSRISPELPAAEARALLAQIVAGTAAIHAAGVVHRDLKPENIVVATDGRAVIVDFGIARAPRTGERDGEGHATPEAATRKIKAAAPMVTELGVVVGTPRYMSPEQAAGELVDARTDVWALGLIAHELLAGKLPELTEQSAPAPAIDAAAVDAKWPGLSAILARCLAVDPAERYADARALQIAMAPRKRRWPWLAGGGVALAAAAAGGFALSSRGGDPTPPVAPVVERPFRLVQLTTTGAREWPNEAPTSIALAPDGSRYAYTAGGNKLFVRGVAGGPRTEWTVPRMIKPRRSSETIAGITASGWFRDGSIALVGRGDGDRHVLRLRADGTADVVYSTPRTLHAAVSPDDRLAIATDADALWLATPGNAPRQIAPVGPAEAILAIAWAPDGSRLAIARQTGAEATLQILRDDGTVVRDVWRGRTLALVDPLLAWVAADRLAFGYQDPDTYTTHLLGIDVATGDLDSRRQWDGEYLGAGSAANGTVVLLQGPAPYATYARSSSGVTSTRLHAETVAGGRVAGWTADGRVVFLEAGQIVAVGPKDPDRRWRGALARTAWPGTQPGDLPDSVVDDAVVVHRVDAKDPRFVLVDKIAPDGTRTQLARIDNDELASPVRCAGDRTAPCVLEQIDDAGQLVWTELDPRDGKLGPVLHRTAAPRNRAEPPEPFVRAPLHFAVSHDGTRLAIVLGAPDVTLVDIPSATVVANPPAFEPGTGLQAVGFEAGGALWLSATNLEGRRFGLARTRYLEDDPRKKPRWQTLAMTVDDLRWYSRPTPLGASTTDEERKTFTLAVTIRELHPEIWLAEGI